MVLVGYNYYDFIMDFAAIHYVGDRQVLVMRTTNDNDDYVLRQITNTNFGEVSLDMSYGDDEEKRDAFFGSYDINDAKAFIEQIVLLMKDFGE